MTPDACSCQQAVLPARLWVLKWAVNVCVWETAAFQYAPPMQSWAWAQMLELMVFVGAVEEQVNLLFIDTAVCTRSHGLSGYTHAQWFT